MQLTVKSLMGCLVVALAIPATALAQPSMVEPTPDGTPEPAAMPAAMPAPAPPPQIVYVQVPEKHYASSVLYGEVGGNAGIYSLNYERYLRPDAAVRVGFMYMSISATSSSSSANVTWAAIPVMFEYLGIHSGAHALELGGGLSINYLSGMSTSDGATAGAEGVAPIGTATVGYRYSDPNGGFVFKIGYTPLIALGKTSNANRVFNWGGMSFGYRF